MSEFIVGKGCDEISCALCGGTLAGSEGLSETAYRAHRAGCQDRPATTSTTCARCSATIDPAAVGQHHERCFVVGDWVRWWPLGRGPHEVRYSDVCVADILDGSPYTAVIDSHGPRWSSKDGLNGQRVLVNRGTVRHIQRPGQAVREIREQEHHRFVRGAESGPKRIGPPDETCRICLCDPRNTVHHATECKRPHRGAECGCAVKVDDPELQDAMERADPLLASNAACSCDPMDKCPHDGEIPGLKAFKIAAPTLYDGLTAEQCLERYTVMQRSDAPGFRPTHTLTPTQITAARDLWSQQLKQRISAAKERERLTVRIDVQDED